MLLSDFDYNLPEELIAQHPCEKRENSKMLFLGANGEIEHKHFYDIVDLLDENTLLVLNNTKVIPARLFAKKDTGANIEIFLLKGVNETAKNGSLARSRVTALQAGEAALPASAHSRWEVLIKPSKRVKPGMVLEVSDELQVKIIEPLKDNGKWLVELIYEGNVFDVLTRNGHIPLPPYIERQREAKDDANDTERYQTVYAQKEGSVAAPTAGLHFTEEILSKLKAKGVEIAYVTLNVGLGTFRPVKCENILEHKMDSEIFEITEETAAAINKARAEGKKLVAVGTTTVRTLETAFQKYGEIKACQDASELFIYPGYEFRVVDKLLTNFHLPKSTLLMLISALAGKDNVFNAYDEAIKNSYRFYSYGDCMLIS